MRVLAARIALLSAAVAIAIAGLVAAGTSVAQPGASSSATVQIGARNIRIPVPPGFVETSRRSQELWTAALAFNAGDARIIAHFVTEKDLADFEAGKDVVVGNFLLVQTPKRAEGITATQAQFDTLRAGTVALQADLGRKLEPRLAAELDRVTKAISSNQAADIKLRLGEIVPVSIERNEARVMIYTILSQAEITQGTSKTAQPMIAGTAYCFVSGKVVMLAAHRQFRTPRDLQAMRTQIGSWADAVLAAN
jgi:hypothetical protein